MKILRVWPLLAVFGILASSRPSVAQVPGGYVQVNGYGMQDSNQHLVTDATISFCPVNNQGVPISFNLADYGQATDRCVTALVTNGGFTTLIAEGAQTNPQNVCFNVTVIDNVSGNSILGPGYNCVQPSGYPTYQSVVGPYAWCTALSLGSYGGKCNFDLYVPDLGALAIQQPGIQGPPGPMGTLNFRGNWTASTPYALNDGYSNSGSLYVVKTAYTSGSAFGSTDTSNTVQLSTGLPLSGGTVTGPIVLPGNPTASLQAAPKQYIDNNLSTEISRAESAEAAALQLSPAAAQTVTQPANTNVAYAGGGTGTFDLSAMPQFKAPVVAGYTTTASGQLGHDSTNHNWHLYANGADNIIPLFPSASPPNTGHVAGFLKTGNAWTLQDLGASPTLSSLGGLAASNNLSELAASPGVARGNLGLGSAATHASTDFDAAGAAANLMPGMTLTGNVAITAQSAGSGYSGTGTCAINGGTYTTQATCTAMVTGGGLAFEISNPGVYTVAPTSLTFSGFTYTAGSAASATVALAQAVSLPANLALGGFTCPPGLLDATACFQGMAFYDGTIGPGQYQIPAASLFASLPWNPVYMVTDGATPCDTNVGGGNYTVPVYSDGAAWHPMTPCSGGGVTVSPGQVANIAEQDNLSTSISVKSVRPGATGVVPTSKKILPDCATGWNGSALTPTKANSGELGDRYCDTADQSAGEGAGGPTESVPTYTTSGAGTCPSSTCPISTNLGGGSGSPTAVTAEYGLTTYDSVCDTSPPATPVAGLAPAPCVAGSGALFSQTTPSLTADENTSTLLPTHWPTTTTVCNADHFYEDVYFLVPTFTGNKRLEFDKNVECGGNYYSIGMAYNFGTSRFDFLPGNSGGFGGHNGSASGCAIWCPMYYAPVGGGSILSTMPLTAGHWIHLRGFYHRSSNLATQGTQANPNFFYDEVDLADLGSSGTGADVLSRYNLIDPNNSNKSPSGYNGPAGSPAIDLQWQLYSNAVSSTASVEVENDTFTIYSLVAGSGGGGSGFFEQSTDLGELDFDGSSLSTDTDTSDGSTIATVGTPTQIASDVQSGAGAMQCTYQSGGCAEKATFSGAQNLLYTRFYINPTTLTTDTCTSGCTARIFQLNNGAGTVFHIYITDGSGTITAWNDAWTSGAGAQSCTVTTTALTVAATGAWPFLDFYWTEGSSTSTGAWTVLWNGNTPADANCSQTAVNTGYTGTYTGATYAELGYITDGGTAKDWVLGFDDWGITDAAEPLYNGFIGQVTLNTNVLTYQPYMSGVTSDGANGLIVEANLAVGGGLNQVATNAFASQCTMSSATTCATPAVHAYNSQPICEANPAAAVYTGGSAYCTQNLTTGVVTVTAPTSNSLKWNVITIGNPN